MEEQRRLLMPTPPAGPTANETTRVSLLKASDPMASHHNTMNAVRNIEVTDIVTEMKRGCMSPR